MPIQQAIIDQTLRTSLGEEAYNIVEKLLDNGYEAYWVGGSVRDMLQERIPDDIDIATNALPEEVIELFPKTNALSQDLGNILVQQKVNEFEVTTFRKDDEKSDGRHPEKVEFGTKEEDAFRRDITVNAIYFQPITREMYDPCGGEMDLEEKLIRIIGEPEVRLNHDYLRILRVVRFRALLDGQYHPDTYHALHKLAPKVSELSGARYFSELQKILMNPRADRALEDLWELDILEHMIPELASCKGVAQPADYHHEGDVWEHTLQCVRSFQPEHNIDVRLAALFHDIGKVETFSIKERIRFDHHATVSGELAQKILQNMSCPKERSEKIKWLVEHHMMMAAFTDMNDERKAHWYFHPWFAELLQLFWLDIAGTDPADFHFLDSIITDYNKYLDNRPRPPKPLLTGQEIMDILQTKPGEKVGQALKLLHDAQIRKEISTKNEAIEFLKKAVL